MPKSAFEAKNEATLRLLRPHFVKWLGNWPWPHFVTLATNDRGQSLSTTKLLELLRGWDARMNRRLFGPKWTERPDQRLFAAYFLEKPKVNPHWHGLIMLDEPDPLVRSDQRFRLFMEGESMWRKLKRGGTMKVEDVDLREGVAKYITKEVGNVVQYDCFVVPRGFDPTGQ